MTAKASVHHFADLKQPITRYLSDSYQLTRRTKELIKELEHVNHLIIETSISAHEYLNSEIVPDYDLKNLTKYRTKISSLLKEFFEEMPFYEDFNSFKEG